MGRGLTSSIMGSLVSSSRLPGAFSKESASEGVDSDSVIRGSVMRKYRYYKSCVGFSWDEASRPDGLISMIDNNIEITRRTFLSKVDREELDRISVMLGYSLRHPVKCGLTMRNDYHITYHHSKFRGKRVYYFRHSAIEYIFTL